MCALVDVESRVGAVSWSVAKNSKHRHTNLSLKRKIKLLEKQEAGHLGGGGGTKKKQNGVANECVVTAGTVSFLLTTREKLNCIRTVRSGVPQNDDLKEVLYMRIQGLQPKKGSP